MRDLCLCSLSVGPALCQLQRGKSLICFHLIKQSTHIFCKRTSPEGPHVQTCACGKACALQHVWRNGKMRCCDMPCLPLCRRHKDSRCWIQTAELISQKHTCQHAHGQKHIYTACSHSRARDCNMMSPPQP